MLLVISQFNCLPGSSEEGWELGCTIKMTSAYKLMFGILGEHYLANSHFYFYFGGWGLGGTCGGIRTAEPARAWPGHHCRGHHRVTTGPPARQFQN